MTTPKPRFSLEEIDKQLAEEDRELLERAKTKDDCIIEVIGYTESVLRKTIPTRIREGGLMVGSPIPYADGGYISKLEIKFSPEDEDKTLPLRKLVFHGFSSVTGGRRIIAGIFAGEERSLHTSHEDPRVMRRGKGGLAGNTYSVYVPRPLNHSEEALYIELYDPEKRKVVEEARGALHYEMFETD